MTPELEAAYAEPHRRYHDRRHIEACLELLAAEVDLTDAERQVLTYAIWWHDAVYDPTASDNELRSAAIAKRALADLDVNLHTRDEVARLILLTAGHEVEEGDRLGQVLVSVDLAILGAEPDDYDAYVQDVRAEFSHVTMEQWRAGRSRVLQRFLDATAIYPDPNFELRFEALARRNLGRELASLGVS